MSDLAIVERALKALRRIAGAMRYGGLGHLYTLAGDALEALERIKQPSFWSLPSEAVAVEKHEQAALL